MPKNTEQCCLSCGTDISNKRKDAKYCSDRCRMRYRRKRIKEKLIGELREIFTQLPNHSVQLTNDGLCLVGINVLTRRPQKWALPDLYNMSIGQIKELKRGKEATLAGENLANMVSLIRQKFKS